jgi:hypothetical protein
MKSLLLLSFLLSTQLFASKEVGNGGDAVVCRNNAGDITSVELLDYYEARVMRGIEVNLGGTILSVEEKVDLALSRIKTRAPKRFQRYQKLVNEFFEESKFISNIHLVDISDSENVLLGKGCVVEQLAIQQEPIFEEDARYLINKDLWDLLSLDHQAGLVLHEIIYFEAIHQFSEPHENSKLVRYFNSFISSDVGANASNKVFYETIIKSKLHGSEEIKGHSFYINAKTKLVFDTKGETLMSIVTESESAYLLQGKLHFGVLAGSTFLPKPSTIWPQGNSYLATKMHKATFGQKVQLDENQFVIEGLVHKGQSLVSSSYELEITEPMNITFHPETGSIKEIFPLYYSEKYYLEMRGKVLHNGEYKYLCYRQQSPNFTSLKFDIDGNLLTQGLCFFNSVDINFLGQQLKVINFKGEIPATLQKDEIYEALAFKQQIQYYNYLIELKNYSSLTFSKDKLLKVFIENNISFSNYNLTGLVDFYFSSEDSAQVQCGTLAETYEYAENGLALTFSAGDRIFFDDEGKLDRLSSYRPDKDKFLTLHGQKVFFWGEVHFHKNGSLKYLRLAKNTALKCKKGHLGQFKENTHVEFDEDGTVNHPMICNE